ncbi:hypothetical protein [Nitrobacter sp.]
MIGVSSFDGMTAWLALSGGRDAVSSKQANLSSRVVDENATLSEAEKL